LALIIKPIREHTTDIPKPAIINRNIIFTSLSYRYIIAHLTAFVKRIFKKDKNFSARRRDPGPIVKILTKFIKKIKKFFINPLTKPSQYGIITMSRGEAT
jgi:hypothetical protein